MKRTQVAALAAGTVVGLTGLAVAVVLSRREGRKAARRLLAKTEPLAERAKKAGSRAIKTAVEEYRVIAPRAAEAVQTAREQAPRAIDAVSGALPWRSQNGKHEAVEATA